MSTEKQKHVCRVLTETILTWSSCKHDGEQVDAHGDGVEDGESSEAVGDGISLRRSESQRSQRNIHFIYLKCGRWVIVLCLNGSVFVKLKHIRCSGCLCLCHINISTE